MWNTLIGGSSRSSSTGHNNIIGYHHAVVAASNSDDDGTTSTGKTTTIHNNFAASANNNNINNKIANTMMDNRDGAVHLMDTSHHSNRSMNSHGGSSTCSRNSSYSNHNNHSNTYRTNNNHHNANIAAAINGGSNDTYSRSSNTCSVNSTNGRDNTNNNKKTATARTKKNNYHTGKKSSNKNKNKDDKNNENPMRVLGIALIVDQKGLGARMLARYPTRDCGNGTNNNDYDDDDDYDGSDDDDINNDEDDYDNDYQQQHRKESNSSNEFENGDDSGVDDDLFFTLTARQMAKLFRTKKALCNQPMTLRVNKTVFCCHAILDESKNSLDNDNNDSTNKTKEGNDDNTNTTEPSNNNDKQQQQELRLFSVVVALSGSMNQQSALPFTSFWNPNNTDSADLERYLRQLNNNNNDKANDEDENENNKEKGNHHINKRDESSSIGRIGTTRRISSVFLAIRRVHISLARFCRALHREENRCGYITYQSRALFRIRNERQKQWEIMYNSNNKSSASTTTNTNINTINIGTNNNIHTTPHHSRQNSFMATPGSGDTTLDDTTLKQAFDNHDCSGETLSLLEQEQEKEQEILELMLACNPQQQQDRYHCHLHNEFETTNDVVQPSQQIRYGNMIRDLVAVFHSLSRNDNEYPPTPSSLLCEPDAIVYVNQHLAVPIDAAGIRNSYSSLSFAAARAPGQHKTTKTRYMRRIPRNNGGDGESSSSSIVQPYYTLLFPHASPSELLQTFHSSGSVPPQQMEHLLLTVNPQKSLTQIAIDANLPLHTTIRIASFLVSHGACITSPVVTYRSRLTCLGVGDSIRRIPELSLDFSQVFPGINLFGVISYLTTSSRELGHSMTVLSDTGNEEGAWLRDALKNSFKSRYYNGIRANGIVVGGSGVVLDENGTGFSNYFATTAPTDHHLMKDNNIIKKTNAMFIDDDSYSPILLPYATSRTRGQQHPQTAATTTTTGTHDQNSALTISVHTLLKEMEEILYAIAIWLLSHRVLTQLQEYLVMVDKIETTSATVPPSTSIRTDASSSLIVPPVSSNSSSSSINNNNNNTGNNPAAPASRTHNNNTNKIVSSNDSDEMLFKEFVEMDFLNGDITIMSMAHTMAIDPQKLRQWGLRHERVRIRESAPNDQL